MNLTDGSRAAVATNSPVGAGQRQDWAWLNALGQTLDFGAGIVDGQGRPGFVVGASAISGALGVLLTDSKSVVSDSARNAFALNQAQRVATTGLVAACTPVTLNEAVVGVLVVAHEPGERSAASPQRGLVDVDLIAPWLARAVEAQLGRSLPEESPDTFDRVASLHRLLQEGVERGSEHDVVTAFVEALFAWEGIEVSAYVEDLQGQLVLATAAPGATRGRELVNLPAGVAPRSATLTQLTVSDLERFGFPTFRQTAAIEIQDKIQDPWLILFSEGYRSLNISRVQVYADLLREALGRASTIVETRATWAILQSLLGTRDAESAMDTSLREFSRTMDASGASFTVTSPNGATILSAGEDAAGSSHRLMDSRSRLAATAPLPDRSKLQLTVWRAAGKTFTRRDQRLVDRAAAIFAAWLPGVIRRATDWGERRSESRTFEEVLERAAAQILRDGFDVSVLVIALRETTSRSFLLQGWVTELRSQLRGSDLAGTLSDREIGVLLFGTSEAEVPVVCDRLRRRLGLDGKHETAVIGSASRSPANAEEDLGSLVESARERSKSALQK